MTQKPADVIRFGRKALWLFGLYHGKNNEKYFFYYTIRTITIVVISMFPLLLLLKLILRPCDVHIFLDSLMYLTTITWFCIKIYLHLYRLKKLRKLEDFVDSKILNLQTEEQARFVAGAMTKQKLVISTFRYMTYIFTAIFALYPIIMGKQDLIMPIWTPFEPQMEELATYVFETFYLSYVIMFYPSLDAIYIGATQTLVSQFQLLKDNLKRALDRSAWDSTIKENIETKRQLKICVAHHNAILE
uniref:Odorant receptor n=1 Tax=Protaetia brevitarsis TaxID=348688 RepID=A0A411HR89_PROBE|nr:odorant receptor [Protaetia brevitarsis]